MFTDPLKCMQYDNQEEKVFYGTCPEGNDRSCTFALDVDGTIIQECSNDDYLLNSCGVEKDTPFVVCRCSRDGCNKYCSWFDCMPNEIQLNSTNVAFPEVMNSTLKTFDEVCTARCWPIV